MVKSTSRPGFKSSSPKVGLQSLQKTWNPSRAQDLIHHQYVTAISVFYNITTSHISTQVLSIYCSYSFGEFSKFYACLICSYFLFHHRLALGGDFGGGLWLDGGYKSFLYSVLSRDKWVCSEISSHVMMCYCAREKKAEIPFQIA